MKMEFLKYFESVNKVKVRAVTDTLMSYALYPFGLGTLCAICRTESWVIIFLFSAGSLMWIAGLIGYRFFAKNNPDYLRSEEYQIKSIIAEKIGDKDNQFNPNIKEMVEMVKPQEIKLINKSEENIG